MGEKVFAQFARLGEAGRNFRPISPGGISAFRPTHTGHDS